MHFEQALARGKVTGGERAALQLALGRAWLAVDEPGLAAPLLNSAATSDTPVAPWASWFASEADLRRGAFASAASQCERARTRWPEGPYADACLVRMGDARAANGDVGAARAAYDAWLATHPESPREEPIRLSLALASARRDPEAGIPRLQDLVLDHAYHTTGQTAQAALDALASQGFATKITENLANRRRLAQERRRCGATKDALARFEALAATAGEAPEARQWVEDNELRFRLDARQYGRVADALAMRLATKPDADVAWQRWLALSRGGAWNEAASQYADGMARFPGRFRDRATYARALTVAGRWDLAIARWDELAGGSGTLAREAAWMGAFSAFRSGADDALPRLDAVVEQGDSTWADAARWYRARALEVAGRVPEARAVREELARRAPHTWYGVLARNALRNGAGTVPVREGRWPVRDLPSLPVLQPPGTSLVTASGLPSHEGDARPVAWRSLRWGSAKDAPALSPAPAGAAASLPSPAWPDVHLGTPPPVRASFLYTPATADTLLQKLARERVELPELAAVRDLAWAGQFDLSGARLGRTMDALADAKRDLDLPVADARQVYLYARDLHHAVKTCWNAAKLGATPEQRDDALRCAFPAAESAALWQHGARFDLDPLLAMGIMRQESVFRPWALSQVGAIGLVQVMPKTGGRVAALLGDTHYSPEQLEDPATNLRYGTFYLGELMDRFGGAWPLAVASYNGGPHNVSSWLRPWRRADGAGFDVRVDDLVEAMPYPETRDYVKKVGGWYATFLSLYAPGEDLHVPLEIPLDDPEVIDF